MRRNVMMQMVLCTGVAVGFFGALPAELSAPFQSRADAGPRAAARRFIRAEERVVRGREKVTERRLHQERRQLSFLKRELRSLRPLRR
jgi:hypothetical protein